MNEVCFTDVIRQFERMCSNYSGDNACEGCPLGGVNIGQCRKIAFNQSRRFVTTVMQWAAENPEPVYPTWYRWLILVGAVSSVETLFDDLQNRIPADIAEEHKIDPWEE